MWIIILLLISAPLVPCGAQEEQGIIRFIQLEDFKGQNLTKSPYQIDIKQAVEKVNLITDEGGMKSRQGYIPITGPNTSKDFIALFNFPMSIGQRFMILQAEDELWATADPTPTSTGAWVNIKTGISWEQDPLRSAVLDDRIWFTNPIDFVFSWVGDMSTDSCEEHTFIPKGFDIEAHNNQLYIGGTYDNVKIVYFSEPAFVEGGLSSASAWPVINFHIFGHKDGGKITALRSYLGNLYAFERNKTWRWDLQQPINDYYGCVYKETIKPLKNFLVLMSNQGVAVFNGATFQRVDEDIREIAENSRTNLGRTLFWKVTSDSDFNAGTSTGILVAMNEIKLEDVSKVWSSSATYPTAFSSGTFGTPAHTEIVNDSVRLTKVNASTDTSLEITQNNIFVTEYFGEYDLEFSDLYNLIDTGSGKLTTKAEFLRGVDFERIPRGRAFWSRATSFESSQFSFIFDVIDSSKPITYCEYKFNVAMMAASSNFATSAADFSDVDRLKMRVKVIISGYTEDGTLEEWGSKEEIIYQEKEDYEESITLTNFYFLKTGAVKNKIIQDRIDFEPKETYKIRFDVEFSAISQDKLIQLLWGFHPQYWYDISIYGDYDANPQYKSTGTLTSEEYDFEGQVHLSTATFDVTSYDYWGTTITHLIRSKLTSWTTYYPISNGGAIPSQLSPCRYVQVLSSFTTTISSYTPTLHSIKIGAIKSTAVFVSAGFNAVEVEDWFYFLTKQTNHNQTITISTRTASTEAGLASGTWGGISSGDSLTAPATHTWIQVKINLATDNGIENPSLQMFVATWTPDFPSVTPASIIIGDRYLLAISTSGSANTGVLVWDKKLDWGEYHNMIVSAFTEFAGNAYFADDNEDKIYMLDQGYLDKGTEPIEIKYKFKKMDFNEPGIDKHINSVYLAFLSTYSISGTTNTVIPLNFSYTLEDSTVTVTRQIDMRYDAESTTPTYCNTSKVVIRQIPIPEGLGTSIKMFQPSITSTATVHLYKMEIWGNKERKLRK